MSADMNLKKNQADNENSSLLGYNNYLASSSDMKKDGAKNQGQDLALKKNI